MKYSKKKTSHTEIEELVRNGQPLESIPVNEISPHLPVFIRLDLRGDSKERLQIIRRIVLYYFKKKPGANENISYLISRCASSMNNSIRKDAIEVLQKIPKEEFRRQSDLFYSDEIQYAGKSALTLAKELFFG